MPFSFKSKKPFKCNMNRDTVIQVALNTDPDTLKKLCLVNKFYYEVFKENKEYIYKKFLEKYQVENADPSNLIYIYNKVSISDYKKEETFYCSKIFELYMKNFYLEEIHCSCKGISSFPVYPNMIHFYGDYNELRSFPVQPSMTHFHGIDNELKSFPVQPCMTNFYGSENQLTSFPVQPSMFLFNGNWNKITSFSSQPNMEIFHGDHNELRSFPVQPNMEYFEGNYNQLTSFPVQPNMKSFIGNSNQLGSFHVQPNTGRFEGNSNQLTTFPVQPKMIYFQANSDILPIYNRFQGMNVFSSMHDLTLANLQRINSYLINRQDVLGIQE